MYKLISGLEDLRTYSLELIFTVQSYSLELDLQSCFPELNN